MRPEWDSYFLELAKLVSTRSTCTRASVGAILVKRKRLLASGYNGSLPGLSHCIDIGVGCLIEDGHCQRAIHAEVNAIAQAARFGIAIEGAILYFYDSENRPTPCRECMKVINAAGVKVYSEKRKINA